MPTSPSRIVCPVDFSEPSRHGMTLALAVARWFGARLTLLYVHQLVPFLTGVGPAAGPTLLSHEERQTLTASLRAFGGVDDVSHGTVDSVVVEDSSVAGGILNRAAETNADLIIIGTQGRSRLERFGLGSVAEKVLRQSFCPVLAVPPQVRGSGSYDPAAIRQVVCALDFSPHSINALPHALLWASKAGARVTALHVAEISPELAEPPLPEFEAYRDRVLNDARRHLADAVRETAPHVPIEQRLAVGRAAVEILGYAANHKADLIVMGIRGRSPIDMAFFGSTANRVVRQAPCPVLTTHVRS